MNSFSKNIIITGASGLLGKACTEYALEDSFNVFLVDKFFDMEYILSLKNKFPSLKIIAHKCDITCVSSIREFIDFAFDSLPIIEYFVHCAYPRSSGWGRDHVELREDDLKYDLFAQLGVPILLTKFLIEAFIDRSLNGNIVFLSSIQGIAAPKFDHYDDTDMSSPIEYSAMKAGIISITKWLAKRYGKRNIRFNCISPGGVFASQPQSFVSKYRSSCLTIGLLDQSHIVPTIFFLLDLVSFKVG